MIKQKLEKSYMGNAIWETTKKISGTGINTQVIKGTGLNI